MLPAQVSADAPTPSAFAGSIYNLRVGVANDRDRRRAQAGRRQAVPARLWLTPLDPH